MVNVVFEGNPERSGVIGVSQLQDVAYASLRDIARVFAMRIFEDSAAHRIEIGPPGNSVQLSEKSKLVTLEDTLHFKRLQWLTTDVIRSGHSYFVPLIAFLPLLKSVIRKALTYDARGGTLRVGKPGSLDLSTVLMHYRPDGMLIRIPTNRPLRKFESQFHPGGQLDVTIAGATADVAAINGLEPMGLITGIIAEQAPASVLFKFKLSARVSSTDVVWEESASEIRMFIRTSTPEGIVTPVLPPERLQTPDISMDPEKGGTKTYRESERDGKPRLFVDCPDGCDEDLIKSELTFINYVRDREVADIHLLVTTQPAGNLGKEYTLTFIGLRGFAGIADTLKFVTVASDTDDLIRRRLVNSMKLGLMRYIARTPLADDAEIAFPRHRGPVTPVADPWDSWVFYADASTEFQGQKSAKDVKLSGSFSVNRVTEDLKFRLRVSMSYAENRYDYSDAVLLSIARSGQVSSLIAVGLGEHWSTGLFASLSSSTFNNTQLWANVGPALEVDLFPYSQHSRRQFPIMYKMQYNRAVYISETIYDRTSEKVFSHSLSVGLDLKEPWGTVSVSAEGSQYFHDLSKNRLVLQSKLSFRLLEGFSLWLAGSLSMIHDQITLPKLDATPAEVLLNRRELETDYYYYAGIGLSFTFGSIYSNIVNPRFGN